jgi:hypothetical protein
VSQQHSRLQSDDGNALLEFVLFFATGLLLIILLSANFEREVRARGAALSIANESLRAWQISQDANVAQNSANSAAAVFQLEPSQWSLFLEDRCSSNHGYRVVAMVGGVRESVQGVC